MAETSQKKKGLDMTKGNAFRLILAYTIPLLCGNILQQFYNMVDSWVVGNFATAGDLALAAVGNGGPVTFLVSSIFTGFAGGVTVLVAQMFGANDTNGIRKAADTAYSLILPVGIGAAALFVAVLPLLLRIMRIPEEIYKDTWRYCFVCLAGIIGPLGYNTNTGIMQGMGDTRTPLILLICSSVMNIILDMCFVIFFRWDAMGVALATIIAQTFSWVVGIFIINKRYRHLLHITPFRFRVTGPILKEILRIGIPSAVQMSSIAMGDVVMQNVINANGTSFAAGAVCGFKLDSFIVLPCLTFSNAVTTYVGQNIGAGRQDRIRKGIRATLICALLSTVLFSGLCYRFAETLVGVFNSNPDVIKYGSGFLKLLAPFYWISCLMFTYCGVLRGLGRSMITMIATIFAQCILRVSCGYLLNYLYGGLNIYYSFPIGWFFGAGIAMVYFYSGRWKKSMKVLSLSEKDKE